MIGEQSKTVAICTFCKQVVVCGEICRNCNIDANLKFAKYAGSLKEAINCWNKAECDEHKDYCQPKVQEFAAKLLELKNKIEKLESAIRIHKLQKQNPDAVDQILWEHLENGTIL